jgi:hypothetical protein
MARRNVVQIGHIHRQIKAGRILSFAEIMRKAKFREGFDDARELRPFKEHASTSDAWTYERGRLFAFIWPGKTFKNGTRVMSQAVERMAQAARDREIL